jgi:hypothetical protein
MGESGCVEMQKSAGKLALRRKRGGLDVSRVVGLSGLGVALPSERAGGALLDRTFDTVGGRASW